MIKDFEFYHNDDGAVITEYRGNSEIVKIPAYICDKPVTEIGDRCFRDCSIKTIIIPNTVKFIDDCAFIRCSNLKNVYIPNSVAGIHHLAFAGCNSLTNITIPDSVINIGRSAFFDCDSLANIKIGKNVKSIDNEAFAHCNSLTNINVDANNKNYSSLGGVLFDKNKTKLIQYPVGNTRALYDIPNGVISIGYRAFYGCSSLTSVTIPDSVKNIGYGAFYACKKLTDIYILNKECYIDDYDNCTVPSYITIHGYAGSTAQEYANKYGNKFEEIK